MRVINLIINRPKTTSSLYIEHHWWTNLMILNISNRVELLLLNMHMVISTVFLEPRVVFILYILFLYFTWSKNFYKN